MDDDWAFIHQMVAALEPRVDLRVVTSGRDVLASVVTWGPDVVLLDLLLHDVDGFSLLDQLTALDAACRPVVLCTTGGHGANTRVVPIAGWPVGTLPRSLSASRLGALVLEIAQSGRDLAGALS